MGTADKVLSALAAGVALLAALPAFEAAAALSPLARGISQGHAPLAAQRRLQRLPMISIILDDLGDNRFVGARAIALPGPIACAFLPGSPYSREQAEFAWSRGKEVLLHLPLQPHNAAVARPASLGDDLGREQFLAYLRLALLQVPHARGVNNHQGSLLTEQPRQMNWLMTELKRRRSLYFVDSRTSEDSIAYRVALARGVPAAERHVFLDVEPGLEAAHAAFRNLLQRARRDGKAVGIGHPHPATFAMLEDQLPRLTEYGVRLVAPSVLIGQPQRPKLRFSPALTLETRTPVPGPSAARSVAAR